MTFREHDLQYCGAEPHEDWLSENHMDSQQIIH